MPRWITTDPSPEEIRRECERIRATWSNAEEKKRRAWTLTPAELRTVRIAEMTAAAKG